MLEAVCYICPRVADYVDMDEFHFAVARVATAHICRAAGIERSNRAVLDAFTDILVRYLMLLGRTAQAACAARDDENAGVDDAMLAIAKCGAVKQAAALDAAYAVDVVEFLRWLRGPQQARMVHVAVPQLHFGTSLGSAQASALAALPSAAAAAATSATPARIDTLPGLPQELQDARHDWLRTAVNKQIMIGHKDWFVNTEFGPLADPDPIIHGDEA